MAESDSLGGRVRRYVRVGRAMGGVAARVGAERVLGIGSDHGRTAADLRQALGGLKGPLMKVAQILSTIPDALPPDYAQELAHLQADAPHMGRPFVRRRMAAELGPDWRGRFAEFDMEAAAAASLGQVHRARSLDGRDLACKLQYPDMASVVEADLRQLKTVMRLYSAYDGAIDPTNIHAELAERMREELDYRREAAHIRLYRRMLGATDGEPAEAGVHVPEVVDELSTARLLTMTWLEGGRILTMKDAPAELRNRIAYNLFRAWYRPFYNYGVIHGDPHLGNYTVRGDGSVNLLDFGCIRVFPPNLVRGVIDLYRALERGDEALAVQAYETWGFRDISRETVDVLNIWAKFIYGPLLEDRVRVIEESGSGAYGRHVAGQVHAELRRIGGVAPPREFVLMDRAAIGLGSVFVHLHAEINWHALFHDLVGDFDAEAMARRQSAALAAAGLAETAGPIPPN
jgi:predicted unusual protein kinase regulating ubiquinone biosynthesis (AarF/ABC1/UbiB family)